MVSILKIFIVNLLKLRKKLGAKTISLSAQLKFFPFLDNMLVSINARICHQYNMVPPYMENAGKKENSNRQL